ncbi:hypothetical protein BDV3_002257 [Batrachochytrium dendrobatidis]|uniref:Uncharacterized protein n=1 Tax=Batrachochytrium dendrobatidis (strain JEL423) TaxID=403673 RepID=A0A177WXB8_BATDL|nr:hypothetical protein BDEG_27780 [Batrachochytrium dendrobatidis JEL423]
MTDNPLKTLLKRETGQLSRFKHNFSIKTYLQSFYSSDSDIQSLKDADGQRSPPYACHYNHNNGTSRNKLLAVVGEAGCVSIFNTLKTFERPVSSWFAHDNAIFDCAWSHNDAQLVTAAGDAHLRLWDLETKKSVLSFRGHRGSIKSVSWCPTQPDVIATASRDGIIMVWDRRFNCNTGSTHTSSHEQSSKPVISIPYAHVRPSQLNMLLQSASKSKPTTPKVSPRYTASVTSVTFLTHITHMIASVGAADGLVKFWDLRAAGVSKNWRNAVETSTPPKNCKRSFGFSSLTLNHSGTKLYASCLDNSIHEFSTSRLSTPTKQITYPTYKCASFYIRTCVSPDDSMIMSGSTDGGVYMWNTTKPGNQLPLILKGHKAETSGVAWCGSDFGQIATCSDDMTVRVWRAGLDLTALEENPGAVHLRGFAHLADPIPTSESVDCSTMQLPDLSSSLSSTIDSYASNLSDTAFNIENVDPTPFYDSIFSMPDIPIEHDASMNHETHTAVTSVQTPSKPLLTRQASGPLSLSNGSTPRKKKTPVSKSRASSSTKGVVGKQPVIRRQMGKDDRRGSGGLTSILNYFHTLPDQNRATVSPITTVAESSTDTTIPESSTTRT